MLVCRSAGCGNGTDHFKFGYDPLPPLVLTVPVAELGPDSLARITLVTAIRVQQRRLCPPHGSPAFVDTDTDGLPDVYVTPTIRIASG